jgi:Tetratricopeptide repeat
VRRRAFGVLAALALVVAGCSAPSDSGPGLAEDEGRLAAAALQAGDYGRAAELYRQALRKAPDRLSLHYGLGVAATHLDQTAEAAREFGWVVEHGHAGQPEVESARRWLTSAGVRSRPPELQPGAPAPEPQLTAAASARVEGRVAPPDRQPAPVKRLQLFLVEQPSRMHHYPVRTDDDGRFVFPTVAPGVYKLSDRISGPPTWRLKIEAKPGQVVFIDLGPDNTVRSRDDCPDHP